jgi:hypothetical protein
MRCNQNDKTGPDGFATIKAGNTIGFVASTPIFHDGPMFLYMARVPNTSTISTWDAAGDVWFKVAYLGVTFGSSGPIWPSLRRWMILQFNSKISQS